jgi:hypothetical protein
MPNLLLNEETIIKEVPYAKFCLTTHRVSKETTSSSISVILIENVCSITTELQHKIIYLLSGAFMFLLSAIINEKFQEYSQYLILIGFFLSILYFLTRNRDLIITSDGGTKLSFSLGNFTSTEIETLICKIIIQKDIRLRQIQNNTPN